MIGKALIASALLSMALAAGSGVEAIKKHFPEVVNETFR